MMRFASRCSSVRSYSCGEGMRFFSRFESVTVPVCPLTRPQIAWASCSSKHLVSLLCGSIQEPV